MVRVCRDASRAQQAGVDAVASLILGASLVQQTAVGVAGSFVGFTTLTMAGFWCYNSEILERDVVDSEHMPDLDWSVGVSGSLWGWTQRACVGHNADMSH